MKILILETASEKSALILAHGERPIASLSLPGGAELSRQLAPKVSELLEKYEFLPELVAIGQGPGSYTGIRVGAALGQALAFGWGVPVSGFGSLEAFVPPIEGAFAVLFDARSPGFYVQTGFRGKEDSFFEPARLLSVEEAEACIAKTPYLASPHPELIQKRLAGKGVWFETAPDPSFLASLVFRKFCKKPVSSFSLDYGSVL